MQHWTVKVKTWHDHAGVNKAHCSISLIFDDIWIVFRSHKWKLSQADATTDFPHASGEPGFVGPLLPRSIKDGWMIGWSVKNLLNVVWVVAVTWRMNYKKLPMPKTVSKVILSTWITCCFVNPRLPKIQIVLPCGKRQCKSLGAHWSILTHTNIHN